jgi:pyruvate dehydrogenase E1 component alpha subunit
MHIADLRLGVLGANGIVGAGISIALGSALAHQTRATGGIAVAFFGDGAMAEGVLHESLNLAALWALPLVLVCENNGWSEFSPTAKQFTGKLGALAGAFGIEYALVDGNDALAVADAAAAAVLHARATGPVVLECITCRVRGHFEGDAQKYRDDAEIRALAAKDPIELARGLLLRAGESESGLAAIAADAETEVTASIAAARADALPDFDLAYADVYTQGGR